MPHSGITMAEAAIHNPAEPRHFMRLKPARRRVRALCDGDVLAESDRALRLLEVGRDVYDPVFYFPADDVRARLVPGEGRSHCPLKGDAGYFDLVDAAGAVRQPRIAWSYPKPITPAAEIAGLIAFYPDHVTFEDAPR